MEQIEDTPGMFLSPPPGPIKVFVHKSKILRHEPGEPSLGDVARGILGISNPTVVLMSKTEGLKDYYLYENNRDIEK